MEQQTLTPEQRVMNVADSLCKWLESPRAEGRMDNVHSAAHQLRDMLAAYFAGELAEVVVSEAEPF